MTPPPELFGAGYFLAGVTALLFFKPIYENRDRPVARTFALVSGGVAIWSFGLAAGNFTADMAVSMTAIKLTLLGVEMSVAGWLLTAFLEVKGNTVSWHVSGLIAGWVIVMQALFWTNSFHHFMIESYTIQGTVLLLDFGPGYWLHAGISYLLVLIATARLGIEAIESTGIRRKQMALLAFAVVPVFIATVVTISGLVFAPYNVSPFGYLVTAGLFALVLFEGRFLDITTVARRTALGELDDAVITLDDQDRVIDANQRARELFDRGPDYAGTDVREFFTQVPDEVLSRFIDRDHVDTEVTVTVDGEQHHYSISITPVGEQPIRGRLVLLHDITVQKRREQELEETKRTLEESKANIEQTSKELETLNRILRHDVRNDVMMISRFGQELQQHVDEEGTQHLVQLLERNEHIKNLTTGMRDLMRTMLEEDQELRPVRVDSVLEAEIRDVTETYEDAVVTIESPLPGVVVRANQMLSSLFRNLLDNAIQHNDADVPTVTISAKERETQVEIRVSDNGPGIPEEIKESIFGKGESGLESSGTGIGLYLVSELVDQYGGSVRVEDNEPRGATFVVELPKAEMEE